MAAIVLAAGVGAVAKFCPQDLKLEHNRSHVAAATTVAPPAVPIVDPTPAPTQVITPMAVTTVEAPATSEPAPPAKKITRSRRAAKPAATASAAASASAAPAATADAVPDNPYEQASAPGAYGF